MNVGDLVRNKSSESGELGIFMGLRTFKPLKSCDHSYTCAEVFWSERYGKHAVGTIQTSLIEVISNNNDSED